MVDEDEKRKEGECGMGAGFVSLFPREVAGRRLFYGISDNFLESTSLNTGESSEFFGFEDSVACFETREKTQV